MIVPTRPCNAGTALHLPSRPPVPEASDGPHEYFFFSSSCCVRSRDLRIIASSRSCPVHAREQDQPPSPAALPCLQASVPVSHQMGSAQHPKPQAHVLSPAHQRLLSGWRVNNAASAGSQPQHLSPPWGEVAAAARA